ncbi:MAG TPA: hypothetical protein VGO08_24400, partial [Burkholderiales bacterium]|nr:hypothetical protein [Burkholderiales bacterium]
GLRVNGGFFVFRQDIFDYLGEGEELVHEPFQRLVSNNKLLAYPYDGFWLPMDTAKDKARLDELHNSGKPPWCVWNGAGHRLGQVVAAPANAYPLTNGAGPLVSVSGTHS